MFNHPFLSHLVLMQTFSFGNPAKNCLGEGSFMVVVSGFNVSFGLGFEAVYATPPFQVIKRKVKHFY